MRRIILAAILLSGCDPYIPPEKRMDFESMLARSHVVRSCKSGAVVAKDPISGKLLYRHLGFMTSQGILDSGVQPKDFCQ